jgi:hypothetical protein
VSGPAHEIRLIDCIEALTWRNTETVIGWGHRYDCLLELRLIDHVAENRAAAPLFEAIDRLPSSVRRAFLRRPIIASTLFSGCWRDQDIAIIATHLAHALHRSGASGFETGGRRELGDIAKYRSTSGNALTFVFINDIGPLVAPTPAGLDWGALQRLNDTDEAAVRRKFAAAWEIISVASDQAAEFVDAFTEVVAVQNHPPTQSEFNSSSFSGLVGLAVFTNPMAQVADEAIIVDALVHEAIHAALYTHESMFDPLVPIDAPADIRLVSPWTGARLTLEAFCQACVVWYGLSLFWRRAQEAGVGGTRAEDLQAKAARGFLQRPTDILLNGYPKFIPTDTALLLEGIASKIAT